VRLSADPPPPFSYHSLPSSNSAALATGIVYFRIVALTPELFEPAEALQSTSAQADAALLLQEAARRGEFGCVVETSLSKMVQSGVEHCKVADAMQWLQIGECVGGGGGHEGAAAKGK
jgi:peroxin-6